MTERIGTVTVCGEALAFRLGRDSGEVFAVDKDFDGTTLTIEIRSDAQAAAILRALAEEEG